MCDFKGCAERIEKLKLEPYGYDDLTLLCNRISVKRSELDSMDKGLKQLEDKVRTLLMERMHQEHLQSVKTSAGHLSIHTNESIATEDINSFIGWLKENMNYFETVLSKKPYTQAGIKELIGEDKRLPPGLKWFRENKLHITKK